MKIAITADLHLTTREDHPERFRALEDILAQMRGEGIETLVIAGDLFDGARRSYAEFEALCAAHPHDAIAFCILPGNHDPALSPAALTPRNVLVVTEPQLLPLDPAAPPFLLLPYLDGKTMGESIVPFGDRLRHDEWVLIAHGDWSGALRDLNPYEPGVYMPLTNRDLAMFRPRRAILGHIHAPIDRRPVHYPGSPCGLDISETGRRRFLVYDTASGLLESRPVNTDVLFFNEHFVILPMEDEPAFIESAVRARIDAWHLSPAERAKVRVRVRLSGYSSDRAALKAAVERALDGYAFHKDEGPDISNVSVSEDIDRQVIADRVKGRLQNLDWPFGDDEPDRDQVLLDALHVIYRG